MAEARRPWVRRGCTCGDRVEPLLEPGGEVGGDPFEDGERLLQLGELVFGTACGSDSDARGVKTRRNPRGPVGRILQCRRPVCFGRVLQVFPQELGDPWHAGDGFQQNEPQRLDESERSRNGKRPGPPPKDPLAQLQHGRRGQRAAIVPRHLSEDGRPGSLVAGRSRALQRVTENAVVLARVMRHVDSTAHRDEWLPVHRRRCFAEDLEHRGRIRGPDERGELAIDWEQRNRHGERLEHRNRRDERWQIAPTAHGGGERTQAGLEIRPGRPCALEQTGSHERWRYEPPYVVAHLDRVPHGATLAGHVHRLPALAAPDDVSVPAVLEEAGLQVPSHQALVERIAHTGQLCAEHAAAPWIESTEGGVRAHRAPARRPGPRVTASGSSPGSPRSLACREA